MGIGGSKHEMREFRDKVVIVTGGSRGIGLEFAKLAAAEGAKVAIIARDQGRIGMRGVVLRMRTIASIPVGGSPESMVLNWLRLIAS